MEKLITPSIIILFSVATASANSVIAEHESLMHDLFASYSVFSGPYHSNKPLLIGFHLTPIYIDVTEDGFIEGEFWYNLAWNDFRLRWDEEARNIRDLHISKEIIWTPDIVPLSGDVVETIDDRRSAILDYKGEIIFFPRVFLRGRCNGVDLWNPWKEFNCSLKYGSWSHTKEYLDFTNIVQSEPIFFNDLSNPVNVSALLQLLFTN
uniref:Cholinergic receptor, nicotinic, alpha 3 (Neuronal) [Trichechus manatus latirostris] n=1 Tax=Lepeophtheirus salmonis TaxID=72036 RepID=A0A0K2UWT7_LEPSM